MSFGTIVLASFSFTAMSILPACNTDSAAEIPTNSESRVRPGVSATEWTHGSLECMAHRGKTDSTVPFEESRLVEKGTEEFGQVKYETSLGDMLFEVGHSEKLSTLYAHMTKAGKSVYFATLRVPTEGHNDSLADYSSDDGWRFYMSCNFPKI